MSFLFDALLFFAFRRSAADLMMAFWIMNAFGALTILPPAWSGGVNLLVGTIAAILFAAKIASNTNASRLLLTVLDFRQLGFLSAYTSVALMSAIILPRIMSQVDVYPVSGGDNYGLTAVRPSAGNVTQTLYTLVSFCTALAFAVFIQGREALAGLRLAFVAGAAVLIISGFVDIAASNIGASDALDIFRTASYAFLLDNEVLNVRRTTGFMPEASSFGTACVFWCALLLFTRHIFPRRQIAFVVMPLAVLCALLALLSTSSAAYAALAVSFILFLGDCFINLFSRRSYIRQHTRQELSGVLMVIVLFTILLLAFPSIYEFITDMADEIIFNKEKTSSFEERTAWTDAGLAAFFNSFGIGVGVGSIRTSNLFVNILASTGVIGSFFFAGFLHRFYSAHAQNASPQNLALLRGVKLATIPSFVQAALVGTMPDYGVPLGALFGIAIEVAAQKRPRAVQTMMPAARRTS